MIKCGALLIAACAATAAAQCSSTWSQCGGINWTGATCCVAGTACTTWNDWYSQCLPDTTAPTVPTTTVPPTTTPTTTIPSATTPTTTTPANTAATLYPLPPLCDKNTTCDASSPMVCGTDGRSYSNVCDLLDMRCAVRKPGIGIAHEGRCIVVGPELPPVCIMGTCVVSDDSAVCGTNGVTYKTVCGLRNARCDSYDGSILVAHYGPCTPAETTTATTPVPTTAVPTATDPNATLPTTTKPTTTKPTTTIPTTTKPATTVPATTAPNSS